jgi:hypothetical protein
MTAAYSVMDFDPSVVAEGVDARSWPRLSGLRRSKNFTTENTEGHGGPLRFFATALTDSDLSTAFNNKGTPNNKATPNHYHVGSSSCPGRPRASCPRHPRGEPHMRRDKPGEGRTFPRTSSAGLASSSAGLASSSSGSTRGSAGPDTLPDFRRPWARREILGSSPRMTGKGTFSSRGPYLDTDGVVPMDDDKDRRARRRVYRWLSPKPLAAAGHDSQWPSVALSVLRGKILRRSRTTAPEIQTGWRCISAGFHPGTPVTSPHADGAPP